ncbi:Zn(II)2Cys6 transcription factor Ecym_5675 [Eremothecium cymbalariae DBVPG|uniref:Zn(2)-C6 fungal-type domain-containing protein n=1 Tax=Eremothecium cymbalariae (strain CBS 270.75 / DBVPG 7215 / KCTC 17166 / NRRL Y-17582) TaxID=931890 RepID=I6NEB3_ERECY|nr:hypothetical protein Ecym_5675 [Eremothecium cymbalariae DBVPG\
MAQTMIDTLKTKKPKTHYARKGCVQCKKSHIKCDKIQPFCTTCSKRNILCTYELSFVFEDGTNKKRIPRRTPRTKRGSQDIITPLSVNSTSSASGSSGSLNLTRMASMTPLENPPFVATPKLETRASVSVCSDAQGRASFFTTSATPIENEQIESNFNFDAATVTAVATFELPEFLDKSPAELVLFDNYDIESGKWDNDAHCANWKFFDFDWRSADWLETMKMLEANDPIQHYSPINQPSDTTGFYSDSPELMNFVWTMARNTQLFGNLTLFPTEKIDRLIQLLWDLNDQYPVVQDALAYSCGIFTKDFYEKANYRNFASIWGTIIMSSNLRVSVDKLNLQLQKCSHFVEYVALLFSFFLLIAANNTCEGFEWDVYLPQTYMSLRKVRKLVPPGNYMTIQETEAYSIFGFLEEWFCQEEITAQLMSDQGGIVTDYTELEYLLGREAPELSNYRGKYDLMKGCFRELNSIFLKLCLKIMELKTKGVELGGRHMMKYKFLNTNSSLSLELHVFGSKLLAELEALKPTKKSIKSLCEGLTDHRLHYAMKNCNEMYYFGLQVYLRALFMNSQLDSPEITELLERVLEAGHNITCYPTKSIFCHLFIYLGAEVSLLLNQKTLFKNFMDLLRKIAHNGTAAAKNSIQKLNYISLALETRNYTLLVNPMYNQWKSSL